LALAAPALADTDELDVLPFVTTPGAVAPTAIDLSVPTTAAPTAKVAVYVPAGYVLDLTAPAGTKVGGGTVQLVGPSGSSAGGEGDLIADDPAKYEANPQAQACAPGRHAAVWLLSTTIGGQPLQTAVFVDATAGGDTALGAYVLQACFASPDVPAASGGGAGRLTGLELVVSGALRNPASKSTPVWRALVTPYTAGTATANPGGTVEVRCKTPLPHGIAGTKVTYSKQRKTVTVTGKLVAASGVRARVRVHIDAGPKQALESLKPWAVATTTAKGAFTITHRLTSRLYALLYVNPYIGPCDSGSPAPGGCVLQSIALELGPSLVLKPPK
jgi:hypothetical protein